MKDPKSSKPSPKVSPVHESDAAYFTVKTHKGKTKENSPVTSMHISPIKFKDSILNKERLKRSYQASDFLPDIEISPSCSELKKHKVKKVDKNIMFSEVHKQQPMTDDFFGDDPQCSNPTDVSLTYASDLETHAKSKGKVKKNIISYLLINVVDFVYISLSIYIYIYITIYTMNNIIQWNCRGLRANFTGSSIIM